jgi:hypothetical protein
VVDFLRISSDHNSQTMELGHFLDLLHAEDEELRQAYEDVFDKQQFDKYVLLWAYTVTWCGIEWT